MSVPITLPSIATSTAVTAVSSCALAPTDTVPATVSPATGVVTDTVGAVTSGGGAAVTTICGRCAATPSREAKSTPSFELDAICTE